MSHEILSALSLVAALYQTPSVVACFVKEGVGIGRFELLMFSAGWSSLAFFQGVLR